MSETTPNVVTERIIFSGRVQGVGFRYTTRSLAKRHPVRGFVRNLPDGTVELVAQGATAAVNALVTDVAARFGDDIRDIDRQLFEGSERFAAFDVRS